VGLVKDKINDFKAAIKRRQKEYCVINVFLPRMVALYNFAIFFFRTAVTVVSVFHSKAKAFVTGRKGIFDYLQQTFGTNKSPVIWIHCASLGEFEQGRPVIEMIRRETPYYKILITFFSPSGYEVRKDFKMADAVTYLPYDTARNARRFIEITKPVLAIFIKYEFWYHYSEALRKRKIPLISISSIFRKDQFFFSSFGGFYRRTLNNFSHFFVQNHESVALLKSIGISSVTMSGDTRFDRVNHIAKNAEPVPEANAFKNNQQVFVVGSCWPEDLQVLIPFINERRLKFIIAPHEVTETQLAYLEKSLSVRSIRLSQVKSASLDAYDVLIVDSIGVLSRLYRYGEFAYVGGAFGKGLHNILEAACYGVPVFFGNKNYSKFKEATDLINRGGAFEVAHYQQLKQKYELLNDPASFMLACDVTRQYVEENLGATEKIMSYCRTLLKEN
jgi:3-deoxy-D-manno-octulosonic-acid transferase